METFEKKTTILLSQDLYKKLGRLSRISKKSMGRLLRDAAEKLYFSAPIPEKQQIVHKMSQMNVPIGSPEEIEDEILKGRLYL